MQKSVFMIEEALALKDETHGLSMLASAINAAEHCFEEWELITTELKQHLDRLHQLGAIAVKPTGAGAGGYVLSLWKNNPPQSSDIELIPLFEEAA